MIKSVIFDLGNVLISFRPSDYLIKQKYPEKIRNTILTDIFGGPEWKLLDNGNITTGEAIDMITGRSTLKREEIAFIFTKRTEIIYPLEKNVRLLPELKKQGLRLYFLSNFPIDIFDEVKNGYYFFKNFNGGIISAEVRYSKPDRKIYELLLKKYKLVAEECLYIDDISTNTKTAEDLGMKVLFTAGSDDFSPELARLLNHH